MLVGGLLAAPRTIQAQQSGKKPRIGVLNVGGGGGARSTIDSFFQGLRDLGWDEGQNVVIERRNAEGTERLRAWRRNYIPEVDIALAAGKTRPHELPDATKERPNCHGGVSGSGGTGAHQLRARAAASPVP